jgi:hypothetical protein
MHVKPPAGVAGELRDAQSESRWQISVHALLVEGLQTPLFIIAKGRHVRPLWHWDVEEHSPDAGSGGGEDVLQPQMPKIRVHDNVDFMGDLPDLN